MFSESEGEELFSNPNHDPTTQRSDRPKLKIISHSQRNGPLVPTPAIILDMRTLPNPPRELRAKQTGLSKQIQDWLQHNSEFQARLEEAHARIAEVIAAEETLKKSRSKDGKKENDTDAGCNVIVGVKCEMGKHRSVAFAECLSRLRWEGWDVEVSHRDASGKGKSSAGRGGKGGESDRRRTREIAPSEV